MKFTHDRFVHQAGNIEVDMKTPIGHHSAKCWAGMPEHPASRRRNRNPVRSAPAPLIAMPARPVDRARVVERSSRGRICAGNQFTVTRNFKNGRPQLRLQALDIDIEQDAGKQNRRVAYATFRFLGNAETASAPNRATPTKARKPLK